MARRQPQAERGKGGGKKRGVLFFQRQLFFVFWRGIQSHLFLKSAEIIGTQDVFIVVERITRQLCREILRSDAQGVAHVHT